MRELQVTLVVPQTTYLNVAADLVLTNTRVAADLKGLCLDPHLECTANLVVADTAPRSKNDL